MSKHKMVNLTSHVIPSQVAICGVRFLRKRFAQGRVDESRQEMADMIFILLFPLQLIRVRESTEHLLETAHMKALLDIRHLHLGPDAKMQDADE